MKEKEESVEVMVRSSSPFSCFGDRVVQFHRRSVCWGSDVQAAGGLHPWSCTHDEPNPFIPLCGPSEDAWISLRSFTRTAEPDVLHTLIRFFAPVFDNRNSQSTALDCKDRACLEKGRNCDARRFPKDSSCS